MTQGSVTQAQLKGDLEHFGKALFSIDLQIQTIRQIQSNDIMS